MPDKKKIFDIYKKFKRGDELTITERMIYLTHIEGFTSEKAQEKIDIEHSKVINRVKNN